MTLTHYVETIFRDAGLIDTPITDEDIIELDADDILEEEDNE